MKVIGLKLSTRHAFLRLLIRIVPVIALSTLVILHPGTSKAEILRSGLFLALGLAALVVAFKGLHVNTITSELWNDIIFTSPGMLIIAQVALVVDYASHQIPVTVFSILGFLSLIVHAVLKPYKYDPHISVSETEIEFRVSGNHVKKVKLQQIGSAELTDGFLKIVSVDGQETMVNLSKYREDRELRGLIDEYQDDTQSFRE